jgi:hypothetical protein
MKHRNMRFGGWLTALLVSLAPSAQATVLVPGTLAELVRDAQVIVRGRVAGVHPQWADGRRRIETVVEVEASGYLKGNCGERLEFKVPGGDLGRYQSVIVGAPVFRPGDEVVLFLSAEGPALPHLIGFSQGVLRLVPDPDSGRALIQLPPLELTGTRAQPVRRGDVTRQSVPYEEFARRVQALVTPRAPTTVVAPRSVQAPARAVRRPPVRPIRKGQVRTP